MDGDSSLNRDESWCQATKTSNVSRQTDRQVILSNESPLCWALFSTVPTHKMNCYVVLQLHPNICSQVINTGIADLNTVLFLWILRYIFKRNGPTYPVSCTKHPVLNIHSLFLSHIDVVLLKIPRKKMHFFLHLENQKSLEAQDKYPS